MILLLAVFSLTGCNKGNNQTEYVMTENEKNTEESKTEEIAETILTETETQVLTESIELTAEEISFFTEYIQRRENTGFLLSSYAVPQDIDLGQLLYNGVGGGNQTQLTDDEAQAYIEASGQEIYTDIVRFTTTQLDEYLYTKMGIHYEEVSTPLDWLYLPEYDKFYNQHGDTNGHMYECVRGSRKGDIVYLKCFMAGTNGILEGSETNVTLKKNGDGFLFLVNQIIEDSGSAEVLRTIELYEAIYQDSRIFSDDPNLPERNCRITISDVTDTSFDFMIDQFNSENSTFETIFMKNTAVFTGDGRSAAYYGQQYTLHFNFPDITSIAVSGFEAIEGVTFAHNAVPGYEF